MSDQSNPVNWFEIPVNDLDRSKRFYEAVLGLELSLNEMDNVRMAWFPMTGNVPGAMGTLIKADGYTPSHDGTVVYFSVADIEETLSRINRNGGKTLMPKTGIGEHGFIAQFEDCEGNRVALHCMT